MDAVGGEDEVRVTIGERFDDWPIVLAGGIDDAARDARCPHGGDDGLRISKTEIVEVVVGIGPGHLDKIESPSALRVVSAFLHHGGTEETEATEGISGACRVRLSRISLDGEMEPRMDANER